MWLVLETVIIMLIAWYTHAFAFLHLSIGVIFVEICRAMENGDSKAKNVLNTCISHEHRAVSDHTLSVNRRNGHHD